MHKKISRELNGKKVYKYCLTVLDVERFSPLAYDDDRNSAICFRY